MKIVIDTSAAVKWFVREEESDRMIRLRDLIVRGELLALSPDFMLVELANVLRFARGLSKVDIMNAVRAVVAVGVELSSRVRSSSPTIGSCWGSSITL